MLGDLLNNLSNRIPIATSPQMEQSDPIKDRYCIDWRDSAWRIHNLVRALTFPWPMARTGLNGKTIMVSKVRVLEDGVVAPGKVLAASSKSIKIGTGGNSLELLEVRGDDREVIPLKDLAEILRNISVIG